MSPGTRSIVLASVALMAMATWLVFPTGAQRSPLRTVKSAPSAVVPSPPLLARDVLTSGVPLTGAQRRELQDLATQWERATTALETAVRAASEEFDRFAAKAQAEGHTSLAELQERSAELRELSAELRARRQAQSDGALAVLTDAQRRQLQTSSGGKR